MALRNARDVYTRRQEGVSHLGRARPRRSRRRSPDEKDAFFDPAGDKAYRHPTFYDIPDEVAAPVTTPTLATYALRLGDDALVLSHRLARVVRARPQLEEDIALANIGLDLLGQARSLLTYAGEVEGAGRTEDDLAYLRDERDFLNVQLVELAATATSPSRSPGSSCSRPTSWALRRLRDSSDAMLPASRQRRSRRSPTTATTRRSGRCGLVTAPRRATGACRPDSTGSGRTCTSCSTPTSSSVVSSKPA